MMFKYKSKLSVARPNSQSMRTTIPKEVAKFLNLEIGKEIEWEVEFIDKNNINVKIVNPKEETN